MQAHLQLGISAHKAHGEAAHAHNAALAGRGQGIYFLTALEYLRELLIHILANGKVLVVAHGHQVSGIDEGLRVNGFVFGGELLAVGREYIQLFGFGKDIP